MRRARIYVGIDDDNFGMSHMANIIRDAWVFGLLAEGETCQGWTYERIDALYDKVTSSWAPYGHLASRLPDPLRERHHRFYDAAIRSARERGWKPEIDSED